MTHDPFDLIFIALEDIQLEENEEGYSIESGRWNDGSPCFFIGTGSLKRGDKEAKKGRVLVLIKGEEKYEQIGAQHTMGAVYSMVVLDGYRLAAAINSSVSFKFEEPFIIYDDLFICICLIFFNIFYRLFYILSKRQLQ